MAALDGTYPPNRFTIAQDGNAYLNGASLFDDAGNDISARLEVLDDLTAAQITALAALSTTEIGYLDGVTPGTAAAGKVAILGANKNLDVLAVADGGLSLGAGAGTAVTATAAEINLIDGSVAGTAVASKAAVLGADKNLDVLAVADLKLGAGAGTSVSATAAEINAMTDNVPVSVTFGTPTESPAGTLAMTIQFKDGNGTNYSGCVGFCCYYSDAATGVGLGTAFTGFTTTFPSTTNFDGATGNVFWLTTDASGLANIQIAGGSATTTQYLAVLVPSTGRIAVSAALVFAP